MTDPTEITPDSGVDAPAWPRKQILMAGAAAALVLGAGGWFLLGAGNSAAEVTPAAAAPVPAASPKASAGPKPAATQLPASYSEQLGHNPFKALYIAPSEVATATTVGTTQVVTPVQPVATSAPAPSAAPATPTQRYALKLVAISKPSPDVRYTSWEVDGTKKTVLPAQRFGRYGELVVLAYSQTAAGDVNKVILQVGDDSPIEVAVGETISVQ